jgi:hypothetical protein
MEKTRFPNCNPAGDETRHLSLAALESAVSALAQPPRERGRVALLVRRTAERPREILEKARLSPEAGMPGDRWGRAERPDPQAQLAVIRIDVAALIANGQPVEIAGDNLFVELDLSDANLPVGSRLRVGTALLEVSPKPHNGCAKFRARFGADALRFVSEKTTRSQNYRGVYWRVIEAGDVSAADPIEVLSRP